MADDINTAINSGGYVIVPEKAVDGVGKDAIYVYMTYNSNGNQAWKISGGLNGGFFHGLAAGFFTGMITAIAFAALGMVASLGLLLVVLLVIFAILANFALYLLKQNYQQENADSSACFALGTLVGNLLGGLNSLIFADALKKGLLAAFLASGKGWYIDYEFGTGNTNEVSC